MGRKVKGFRIDPDVEKITNQWEYGDFTGNVNEAIRQHWGESPVSPGQSLSTRGPPGEGKVGNPTGTPSTPPGAPGETESESWRSQSTSAGDKRSAPEPGIPQIASAEATLPQYAPGTGAPTVEEPKSPDGSSSNRKPFSATLTKAGRKLSNLSPTPTNAPKPPQSSELSPLLTSLFSRGRC